MSKDFNYFAESQRNGFICAGLVCIIYLKFSSTKSLGISLDNSLFA